MPVYLPSDLGNDHLNRFFRGKGFSPSAPYENLVLLTHQDQDSLKILTLGSARLALLSALLNEGEVGRLWESDGNIYPPDKHCSAPNHILHLSSLPPQGVLYAMVCYYA